MSDTKQKLLDAAERLFAEQGFSATSIRQITARAEANVAALHYHFGSKEDLISTLFRRRLGPLNIERLALLDEALARAGEEGLPPLEEIVEAFVGPPLRMKEKWPQGGNLFMRLMGRAMSEPDQQVTAMVLEQFSEVAQRFLPVFQRSLPGLSRAEVFWRVHFMVGAMAHTMAASQSLVYFSGGCCNPSDPEEVLAHLVPFLAAGLRSPVDVHAGKQKEARK